MTLDAIIGRNEDWPGLCSLKSDLVITARILQLLTDLRQEMALDAENVHILSAFLLAELADQTRGDPTNGGYPSELTASAVSSMTLIPRQTVRRRLESLRRMGFLATLDAGRYIPAARIKRLDLPNRLRPNIGTGQSGADFPR